MRQGAAAAAAALALLLLAGCAGQGLRPVAAPGGAPAAARVADVPFVAQAEGHCGPAALAMSLAWSGEPVAADTLAPQLITPARGGTLEHDLAAVARAEARLAVPVRGLAAVLGEVAAGHPVIVLQNLALAWWPQWHYAVVVGYDLDAGLIELHSGLDRRRRMSLDTFRRTFERAGERGLVVLPPDRLPAGPDRAAILAGAAGLERAGRPGAALAAYRAMQRRWPGDAHARFGEGNALVALGDLDAAAAAFRAAAAGDETAALALNNLGHVLMLRGELEAAEAAAAEALARGGPAAAAARQTLDEIRAARAAVRTAAADGPLRSGRSSPGS